MSPKKQAIIKMPSRDHKQFRLNVVQALWFAPIVVFYLESLIVPVESCKNNPKKAETRAIKIHKPLRYALLFVALEKQKSFFPDLQCGVMDQFVKTLDQLGKQIYNEKKTPKLFRATQHIQRRGMNKLDV